MLDDVRFDLVTDSQKSLAIAYVTNKYKIYGDIEEEEVTSSQGAIYQSFWVRLQDDLDVNDMLNGYSSLFPGYAVYVEREGKKSENQIVYLLPYSLTPTDLILEEDWLDYMDILKPVKFHKKASGKTRVANVTYDIGTEVFTKKVSFSNTCKSAILVGALSKVEPDQLPSLLEMKFSFLDGQSSPFWLAEMKNMITF